MRLALALALAALLAGPAAADVLVESDPPGAAVFDRNYVPGSEQGFQGVTPCHLPLDPDFSHTLYVVLPGYAPSRQVVDVGQAQVKAVLEPASPAAWLARHRTATAGAAVLALALLSAGGFALRRHLAKLRTSLDAREVVDGYRLLDRLGVGSFADVYRVQSLSDGGHYAMKLLRREMADPDALERFRREVEVGRDVRHPNLIRVFGFGDRDGCPYLVLELLHGRTLADRLAEGPLPVEEALHLFEQIGRGLQHVHERGVVHRDLKPDNLMIQPDGTLRIMDFGVAKLVDRQRMTATGMALGTPLYMSPEHLDSRQVSALSDVYSLGCILYEMLTGRPPFEGADPLAVLAQQMSADPAPPRSLNPDVPPEVEALVLRMMAKDPSRRPASVADALRAAGRTP